jgi:hypothetical protein
MRDILPQPVAVSAAAALATQQKNLKQRVILDLAPFAFRQPSAVR